jgi:hypothetical protein
MNTKEELPDGLRQNEISNKALHIVDRCAYLPQASSAWYYYLVTLVIAKSIIYKLKSNKIGW